MGTEAGNGEALWATGLLCNGLLAVLIEGLVDDYKWARLIC